MMNQRTRNIVLCGMFTALFVVLSYVEVDLRVFKLTFSSLPVVISGLLFGPVTGMTVGLTGSFLQQLLQYGFAPTTLLWMIPVGLRGFLVGYYSKKNNYSLNYRQTVLCMVVSSIFVSIANTPVIFIDSKLYGYYSFEYVFGGSVARFITGCAVAVILSAVAYPVATALKRQLSGMSAAV
ncbi:MAG: folate family ECF transporter S component [Lachnospiraceae bacterium]|nr:folate family ECF transporter S component [Lachnospiraceae bacterium]